MKEKEKRRKCMSIYGHEAIEFGGLNHLSETQRFAGNGALARPAWRSSRLRVFRLPWFLVLRVRHFLTLFTHPLLPLFPPFTLTSFVFFLTLSHLYIIYLSIWLFPDKVVVGLKFKVKLFNTIWVWFDLLVFFILNSDMVNTQ